MSNDTTNKEVCTTPIDFPLRTTKIWPHILRNHKTGSEKKTVVNAPMSVLLLVPNFLHLKHNQNMAKHGKSTKKGR